MNAIQIYEPLGETPTMASHATLADHAATAGPVAMASPVPAAPGMPMPAGTGFVLRRSGARPVRFTGRHLGEVSGYRLGTPLWHELNLYQADDGRYVADIRVFAKAQGSKDQFHVAMVDSLEEALQVFEAYDPRADVAAEVAIDDPDLSPAELMVQAAALKVRVADAVSQYRAVLGAFLHQVQAD
jgi:hypothetical protein